MKINGILLLTIMLFTLKVYANDFNVICPQKETVVDSTEYFPKDYESSRVRFIELADQLKNIDDSVELNEIPVSSTTDEGLTINSIYIPATKKEDMLFVLVSGVHGIESFAGAAVQNYFMDCIIDMDPSSDSNLFLNLLSRKNTGYLLIHAVNPWGYKNLRRVTEENIDINRNFLIDGNFNKINEGYGKINHILNKEKQAVASTWDYFTTVLNLQYAFQFYDIEGSQGQVIAGGQYEYPKGLYYGGADYIEQKEPLEEYIKMIGDNYKGIYLADIHTGYGEKGSLYLWFDEVKESSRLAIDSSFNDVQSEDIILLESDGDVFYYTSGDFVDYIASLFEDKTTVLPLTFEFGTMSSEVYIAWWYVANLQMQRDVESLIRTKRENQGFQHGYYCEKSEKYIKKEFLEMYNPSEKAWQFGVLDNFLEAVISTVSQVVDIVSAE